MKVCAKVAPLMAVFAGLSISAFAQRKVEIQLLAINDLHGNLEPPAGPTGMINGVPAGGAEFLATDLANARRRNPNTILVGGGDMFGASPLISSLFKDQPAIEAIDAMGLNLSALGNHELDHGPEELRRRLQGATFQYLAANVVFRDHPDRTLFPATAVRTIGGVKIGFIGEILQDAPTVIAAGSIRELQFLDEITVANAAAARLEGQGVHTIVLLIHEGGFQHAAAAPDGSEGSEDPNGCENFSGEIATLAPKLAPSIQVVISAHTHTFYNCEIAGHVVTSAASYGRMFTRVMLSIDPGTDRPVGITAHNEVVTRDVAKDPRQTAIIERFRPRAAQVANQPAGSITASFLRERNSTGESTLGDLVADAQLAATASVENGGAQIAFMNLGGLRADLVSPPGSRGAHWVRFAELYAVQPFGNQLGVRTMTGDMLKRLLEQQFTGSDEAHFLQVSAGFTYAYRLHAALGEHVVAGSMMLHGRRIAPTDKVRVECSDFMAAGAEGLTVFREATDAVMGPPDVEALETYMKTHSPVSPAPQNRIRRVD